MSAFQFPSNLASGFKISLKETGDTWTVECSGVLDSPDACAAVQPQLLALHHAAVVAKVALVRLEMHGVEYMNSSGLKSFMVWFLAANQSKEHRYGIEVSYDPDRTWQPISLRPMERLAPNVVHLKPHYASAAL